MLIQPGEPLRGTGSDSPHAVQKQNMFACLDEIGGRELLRAQETKRPAGTRAGVPPHVWMYWHDGWDNAPEVAKLCLKSWRQQNGLWDVHAVDAAQLATLLPEPLEYHGRSRLAGFSDRVRLKLLRRYGGIWADATLFCALPADSWVHLLAAPSLFFAFAFPAEDRTLASWFLAAAQNCRILALWDTIVSAYFAHLEAERRWVHSYFFVHYALEYVVNADPEAAALWAAMPKIPVGAASTGRLASMAQLKAAEDSGGSLSAAQMETVAVLLRQFPLHKLTWKGQMQKGSGRARHLLTALEAHLASENRETSGELRT
jgi:hypothetical protein